MSAKPVAHRPAVLRADQMIEDVAIMAWTAGSRFIERSPDAQDLRNHQPPTQLFAVLGEKEQPLTPILLAFPLIDIALLYELAENPSKALFGDAQYVEQLGNRQPGI